MAAAWPRFLCGIMMVSAAGFIAAAAQDQSVEKELQIHRLQSGETSRWDAFAYENRVGAKVEEGETPEDYAGRLFGRLSNQEGRISLKVPPGMDKQAYIGLKKFFTYYGEESSGNCVACHTPSRFTDGKAHVVDASGAAKETPGLRDLSKSAPYLSDGSAKTLEEAVRSHLESARHAREGKITGADEALKKIYLKEEEVAEIVAFLKTLDSVEKDHYRELILNATVLDTSDLL